MLSGRRGGVPPLFFMELILFCLSAYLFIESVSALTKREFFERLNNLQFSYFDIFCLLILVTIILISSKMKGPKPFHENHTRKYWLFLVSATIVFIFTIQKLTHDTAIIGIIATYLATCGWIFTNYRNFKHARKSHTFSTLLTARNSGVYNDHRINLKKHFGSKSSFSSGEILKLQEEYENVANYDITSSGRKMPGIESIYYFANFFEFISAGIRAGDLDKSIIMLSTKGIMVGFYRQYKDILFFIDKDSLSLRGLYRENYYKFLKELCYIDPYEEYRRDILNRDRKSE